MNFYVKSLLGATVFIPAIIAILRFKKIDPKFYPFVYYLFAASVSVVVNFATGLLFQTTSPGSNVYVLLESMLFLWFFKRLGLFSENKNAYFLLVIFIGIVWIVNTLWVGIFKISSVYRIIYSFILVLLSTWQINKLVIEGLNHIGPRRVKLISNAIFLICIGTIIFFTCKILVELFYFYGLNSSREFRSRVYNIISLIFAGTNFLFAIAVLWIPRKREYILLS